MKKFLWSFSRGDELFVWCEIGGEKEVFKSRQLISWLDDPDNVYLAILIASLSEALSLSKTTTGEHLELRYGEEWKKAARVMVMSVEPQTRLFGEKNCMLMLCGVQPPDLRESDVVRRLGIKNPCVEANPEFLKTVLEKRDAVADTKRLVSAIIRR